MKKILGISFLFFCALSPLGWAISSVDLPSGKIELTDFRYPVYLFGPKFLKRPDFLTMLMVLADDKSLEETVDEWAAVAEKHNVIVVVPELRMRDEDVPYKIDEWLIKMKKDLMMRYEIRRVYIIGHGSKAHYAAYLGMKYPREFTAAGTLNGSWVGGFEKLAKPSSKAKKQIPFFVAVQQTDSSAAEAQKKTTELTQKGYDVRLVMLEKKDEENSDALKSDMLTWFESVVSNVAVQAATRPSFKDKVNKVIEEFFAV